jgi:hypothetical protein
MRRPQRRLHLVLWLLLAPLIAAGFALAMKNAPSDTAADLAETIVTGEGD